MTLRAIHDFELALLDPCIAMTERGLPVDDAKRRRMLDDLEAMRGPLHAEAQRLALAALADGAERITPAKAHLFSERRVCGCCRNGKAKRVACWKCAGFEAKPTKKQLNARISEMRAMDTMLDGETNHEYVMQPCAVCAGAGAFESRVFNAGSPQQLGVLLYDVLRLPKRTKGGKLTTDEEALKGLLAECKTKPEAAQLLRAVLTLGKIDTMRAIFERIAPGDDGRIRTTYNPAGTETGRFSSAETFLVRSTNLQNLPKREVTDPRFDVKACIVAPPGFALIEADLSGAEAWVTAARCGDAALLEHLRSGRDVHKWTAARIFDKDEAAITSQERHLGKVARHALNYGMQWQTFQRNVNFAADRTGIAITAAEAKRIVAGYHALHPRLKLWWEEVQHRLVLDGTLTTCWGRRRAFYGRERGVWLSGTHLEAIAFEPQSTIADLLNRGLLRWWRQHDGKVGELLAQVHDSMIVQAPQHRAQLVGDLVRRCMTEPVTVQGVTFTIPVDVKVMTSWAATKEAA